MRKRDSNLQHFLQSRAGGLFVLVEGVGVNIQRGGGLAVAEDARHRGYIRAARNHQAGGGVPEGMDVQLLRQSVLLEDQLEAVGEGGGRHGELRSLTAEQEIIIAQFPLVIGFGDVCAFLPVLPQKTFHLGGEVHIAVTRAGLGFFDKDLLVCHLDRVAADVDGTLPPINVAPFQSAALTPPHPRGDDELEVGFVLDALALQRGDDLLRRFLVRDLFLTFAPGVAVGAPRRIMRKKATLHGIREDAAQRSVHALNGVLGEWLFCVGTDDFSQFGVEIPEVLRPQLGELVVTQCWEDAFDVLPVAADGGLRQLAGSDVRQPQVDVFCQRELLDGLWRMAALPLKEDCLFVEPLFYLPGRQLFRRVDGFLLGFDALAVVVIAHGDHDKIAAAALAYRYLLWGLQSAPKLSEMDTTWEEHLTPSTHWINAGCQKIKESWLVPALLYCALSGSTVTIKVH